MFITLAALLCIVSDYITCLHYLTFFSSPEKLLHITGHFFFVCVIPVNISFLNHSLTL